MEFLNFGMAFFAATAAVPVILHLIMRQNPKHVVFPALRFVRQRNEANRRKLRLRHLVLLALRAGALILLAFALARLTLTTSGALVSQAAPVSAVMVFDTSPRMSYEQDNQTRLAAAVEIAQELLNNLPPKSEIAIFDTSGDLVNYAQDMQLAKDRLERLQLNPGSLDMLTTLEDAVRLLTQASHEVQELYIFTDLSEATWNETLAARLQAMLGDAPDAARFVIDVGSIEPRNTALGNLELSAETLPRNTELAVRLPVSRVGGSVDKELQWFLHHWEDGKAETELKGQTFFTQQDGDSQIIEFRISTLDLKPGIYQGEVRLVGRKDDGLQLDDQRFFTFRVQPPWRVLIASPAPAESYAFDLHGALAPPALRKEDRSRFECTAMSLAQLESAKLDNYHVVTLLDPTPLPDAVWDQLYQYVNAGGRLAIFLGREAGTPDASFNAEAAQRLLPGKLGPPARWPDGVFLTTDRNNHPMLRAFQKLEGVPWRNFPVFRFWPVEQLNPQARIITQYTNGQPAILERDVGRGHVLLMTTPISDELDETAWNTLPTGLEPWPFVMLANESMLYLVGGETQTFNYVAQPQLRAELALEGTTGIPRYLLTFPDGRQDNPLSNPNEPRITIPGIAQVGNYRVQGGTADSPVELGFSVNYGPEQSQLTRLTPEQLKVTFGSFEPSVVRSSGELKRIARTRREGQELFPWLIILVAVLLAAEHVLANVFYGMRDKPRYRHPWEREET